MGIYAHNAVYLEAASIKAYNSVFMTRLLLVSSVL